MLQCTDQYSILCIWYTILLIYLLWYWNIIDTPTFIRWYKGTECGRISVCVCSQYVSAIDCVLLCAAHSSDAICVISCLLIFKYIF